MRFTDRGVAIQPRQRIGMTCGAAARVVTLLDNDAQDQSDQFPVTKT
jgi:hypothetical protein